MQGLQSLMQAPQGQGPMQGGPMQGGPMQGPMPGQAPMQQMPGMMPQQGAPTPGAMTGSLKSMPLDQLKMMYMNPQPNSPPLWAVISALAEKQKEAQAMQMAQGQQAMAQNAQMQQQPPVAAQVMQAAEQMAPQGYAGGGAVAFKGGGASEDLQDDPSLPLMERIRRARLRQASGDTALLDRPLLDLLASKMGSRFTGSESAPERPAAARPAASAAEPFPFGVPESPMMDVPEIQMAPPPVPAPAGPRRQPMAGPAPAAPAAQPALAPSANLSPEMEAYFRNRQSDLRTRQGLPEDIVAGRAGLEALARESIAAQRGEAETFGREARERRDAALARAQRGILDDPQALLALAGSIDTRKGQGIGSLARGAAGLMSQREAAAEAAREKYATAQQTERALQANVRQATMLEAQRAQALREGDFNRANQIKDQIDALMMQRETLLMDRRDKTIEQSRLERGLNIQERGVRAQEASANKPTGTVALLRELGLAPTLENLGKIVEAQQGPKSSAAIRKELVEQWSKNIMLQQKFPNFEDFVAAMAPEAGAAGPGAGEFKVLSSRPKQ